MEEIKNYDVEPAKTEEEGSSFDYRAIIKTIILNWYWFVLSILVCMGGAYLYLRYTTPIYQASAKFLIKESEGNSYRKGSSLSNMSELGIISSTNGFDNEMEILHSHSLAAQAVKKLKLYTSYSLKGKIKDRIVYSTQPVSVDIDEYHLDKLNAPINLNIKRQGTSYLVEGTYCVPIDDNSFEGPFSIKKTFTQLPANIYTRAGTISLSHNNGYRLGDGEVEIVSINSPKRAAYKFNGALAISQYGKTTTIAQLVLTDEIPQRAIDYLRQLVSEYNRQANDDKNYVAMKTEKFIDSRLDKISAELGATEGELESFKQDNKMVELKMNATQSLANQDATSKRLTETETQIALLNSIDEFMRESSKTYQVLPSNVGLTDPASAQLIGKYNELVLERNRLLRSASENSPVVEPITEQIKELNHNISRAIRQMRKNLEIERNAIVAELNKFNNLIEETPEQERKLTQIGRQREVKSGLYLMLLQKREENSISLAATADKGTLIDEPQFIGMVSPKRSMIWLIGLAIGIVIPGLILFLINFFRYKIEAHEDVIKLTKLPIIADVPIANDKIKKKADIVVQANQNNQIEEVFRTMRTNLQFIMRENDKVIMFTSSIAGEGKTFNCANLAVSFALLEKKVILLGLDIRKPRLGKLFELSDTSKGITKLLTKENPSAEDIRKEIVPSMVNENLDLLLAGPIPPNPAELLSHESLNTIFNYLREEYDYILVDTAPVGLVTDTFQIGRVVDATVYTCRADYTPKDSIRIVNDIANDQKLPNICIIINGIDMSKKKYGYAYGYGRYGKYGRYGNYGRYGHYGSYGRYGNYANSHYGNKKDDSIKR